MLKPYMTGNKIKLIGATTEQEYKILENDKALLRRFNKISIKEPNKDTVLHLMENICRDYETYFDLKCPETILSTVVNYADLYMPNRYMPDKAIDLLDQSFVHCKNHSDRHELNDTDIINSIESMTSISVPTPNENINNKIETIINNIRSKLVGQDEVIKITESLLKKYFMGLCNPKKPISSFLFVGPTGVGKTALCKELASNLFNKESFVKLDMSEYMEKYSISKLIGSPPGYEGHTKGGKLTEIVKHNPYSIILFDEIEKAHTDIYNILLQILDDGVLTDSEGYTANFKNCIIVLTSNLGASDIEAKSKNTVGFGNNTLSDKDKNKIYENAVKKYFTPEFINRLEHIVYFNNLTRQNIADIVDIELTSLVSKFKNIKVTINISEDTKKLLYDKCYTKEYGARFVQREITKLVEDTIIEYLLEYKLIGIDTIINIDVKDDKIKVSQPEEVKL
jgi:ATP-dependent Clp protease ATP-binding subunit ClpC